MRKYLVGFIAGALLTFTVSVSAEGVTTTVNNIIGSLVAGSFPVTVNGTKIDDPAAVIKIGMDDKGYLPIRAVGDALGVDITFDPDLGIFINGKPKTVGDTVYQPTTQPIPVPSQSSATKVTPQELDGRIEAVKINIWGVKASLERRSNDDPHYSEFKSRLSKYESELVELEKQKVALQP